MVRKRGRGRGSAAGIKRRSSRVYDNSDDNESDVELDFESPPASPDAPAKRYGLRQRSKRPLITDYYYDDDDETIPTKDADDDDQDYNVVEDIQDKKLRIQEKGTENYSYHLEKRRGKPVRITSTDEKSSDDDESLSHLRLQVMKKPVCKKEEGERFIVEPQALDPLDLSHEAYGRESHDGPVDFEDIIRADVVNKQKVNCDRMISKSDIIVEPLPLLKITKVQKVKPQTGRRRGRKPTNPTRTEYHITADYESEAINNLVTNGDSNEAMEVQLDPEEMLQTEHLDDPRGNKPKENGVIEKDKAKDTPAENNKPNGTTVPIIIKPMDRPEAEEPPDLDPKEKEVVLSNEYLLANAFDYSAEEFVKKQEEDKNKPVEEEPAVPQLIFDSDEDSDDDVIIIEKKPEIIVLDDD